MNENLKKVLIVIGVIAIYHYFFRSMTVKSTVAADPREGIIDHIKNGNDTIYDVEDKTVMGSIQSLTPARPAPSTTTLGTDASFTTLPASSVRILQG